MEMRRNSHEQRKPKAVVFGAGVAGGVIALTSLAFACTPLVGLIEITGTGAPGASIAVGGGRNVAEMTWCPTAVNAHDQAVTGGATADNDAGADSLVTVNVAPVVCPAHTAADLEAVQRLAEVIMEEPRNLTEEEIDIANFLMPGLAVVNFHPYSFDISGTDYTYVGVGEGDCMDGDANGAVQLKLLGGTTPDYMVIGPGTGTKTFQVPSTWGASASGQSGGLCVRSALHNGADPPSPSMDGYGYMSAMAMAPLTVI